MGVPMSVDVRRAPDDARTRATVRRAFAVLHTADRRFSTYRADSEVRRLDRGELAAAHASDDLREVLAIAARYTAATGGAFSVRAPDGSLDPSGVVKGWAAQRAADVLADGGLTDFCLNAGGDVVTCGEREPGLPWRVAVRSPWDPAQLLTVVEQRDGAVATSGVYERGEHVWDGRTGAPAQGLVTVTVTAADLTTADVLATCVLAMGVEGVAWAGTRGGVRAVLAVRPDGAVLTNAVPTDPALTDAVLQGRARPPAAPA